MKNNNLAQEKFMKKVRTLFVAAAIFALGIYSAESQGYPVFDNANLMQNLSSWMTSIDTLYANYDMVMNTITQIENQYRSIQQAVERAKSIDWDNIRFDGDFDIRNDIRDANRRVNRLLTQARTVRNALTTNIIRAPGSNISYSLADLCGMGDENKDVFTAAADLCGYMSDNMKSAADAAVKGVTAEQGMAIMAKYGISPRNFWFAVQTENQVKTAIENAIAFAEESAQQMEVEEEDAKTNAIVSAAMETLDSDGNPTEGAVGQASMMLLRNLSGQLSDLKIALRQAVGLSSKKMLADMSKEEAKAASKVEREKISESVSSDYGARFGAGMEMN